MNALSLERVVKLSLLIVFLIISTSFAAGTGSSGGRMLIVDNKFFSKGGVGSFRQGIYVILASSKNELEVDGLRWRGRDAGTTEVVVISDGRIVKQLNSLDASGFKLGKEIIVSFEGEKIYFFDFSTGSGGYYDRDVKK